MFEHSVNNETENHRTYLVGLLKYTKVFICSVF